MICSMEASRFLKISFSSAFIMSIGLVKLMSLATLGVRVSVLKLNSAIPWKNNALAVLTKFLLSM